MSQIRASVARGAQQTMSEELEVLRIVTKRLDAESIPYMVTGSMAVNYYGVPRMTRDIDIVVELSIADLDRVCALLQDDFYLERETIQESIERRTTFNVIHASLVVKVDFVVRKDTEYRRTEFGRKRRVALEGHPFLIVAPEDLIISKLEWARDTRSEVQITVCAQPPSIGAGDRQGIRRAVDHAPRARPPLPRGVLVRDTSPEMEERYLSMVMARSAEARLKMGDSMYATARALVIASILEHDPSASPAALRQAVFMRFYGHEFDAATRERILARLASADDGGARPLRKRVPVEWDAIELALTWHSDETLCVLDLRTGEVRHCRLSRFAGEVEDFELSEDEVDSGEAEGYFMRIEPLESSVEYGWMAEFAASVRDSRLRDRLEVALDGRGAFRRFKDMLAQYPAERERWFGFRDERVREAMRDWLAEHDIEPTTMPTPERGVPRS
jgi:hypothetical protein